MPLLGRAVALAAAGSAEAAGVLLVEFRSTPDLLGYHHLLAPLPALAVELDRRADLAAALDGIRGPGTVWRDAAAAVAAGRLAEAAGAYGRIGARFSEAWVRLLAVERGAVPPSEVAAAAHVRRIGAAPYLRRCERTLAASA